MINTDYNKQKFESKSFEDRIEIAYKSIEQKAVWEWTSNFWNHFSDKKKQKEIKKYGKGKYGSTAIDNLIVEEINRKFAKAKVELENEFAQREEKQPKLSQIDPVIIASNSIPAQNTCDVAIEHQKQDSIIELKLKILQMKREEMEL